MDAGAMNANTPKEAAMKSDVVITSLTDDSAVLDVVSGEEGILSGLQPNRIHVGTSTVLLLYPLGWLRCMLQMIAHI
ncbi:MAG: NAD(P)-binding domain-containing protein [Candidatus Nitrosopolaris sp.]